MSSTAADKRAGHCCRPVTGTNLQDNQHDRGILVFCKKFFVFPVLAVASRTLMRPNIDDSSASGCKNQQATPRSGGSQPGGTPPQARKRWANLPIHIPMVAWVGEAPKTIMGSRREEGKNDFSRLKGGNEPADQRIRRNERDALIRGIITGHAREEAAVWLAGPPLRGFASGFGGGVSPGGRVSHLDQIRDVPARVQRAAQALCLAIGRSWFHLRLRTTGRGRWLWCDSSRTKHGQAATP